MAFVIPKDVTSSCFQTYLYPTPKAYRIALLLHSTFILHSTENSTFSAGSFLNQRQQYSLFQPPAQELALGRQRVPHHSPLHSHPQDETPSLSPTSSGCDASVARVPHHSLLHSHPQDETPSLSPTSSGCDASVARSELQHPTFPSCSWVWCSLLRSESVL